MIRNLFVLICLLLGVCMGVAALFEAASSKATFTTADLGE